MRTPLDTYRNMKSRCYNPSDKKFKYYGGRGITIHEGWFKNPVSFATWAENHGWEQGKHIHRKNRLEGYTPDNCEWIWPTEHRKLHIRPKKEKPAIVKIIKPKKEKVKKVVVYKQFDFGDRIFGAGELGCQRCGHTWESRVADPASCPKCKSYKWREKRVYGEKDKEGKK